MDRDRRYGEPTAVFHGREAMEDAVHALVDKGISPERIRVSQGAIDGAGARFRAVPERGNALVVGLAIGATLGAVLALAWTLSVGRLVAIPPALIVLRALGGAASGSILGALLALLVFANPRRLRRARKARADDFVVTVKPADTSATEDVRGILALRGGQLLPSSP